MDITGNNANIYSYVSREDKVKEMLNQSEINANIFVGIISIVLSIFYFMIIMLNLFKIFEFSEYMYVIFTIYIAMNILIYSFSKSTLNDGNKTLGKVFILILFTEGFFGVFVSINYFIIFLLLPLLLSCRYFDYKMVQLSFLIALSFCVLGTTIGVYRNYYNGIIDLEFASFVRSINIEVDENLMETIISSNCINLDNYFFSIIFEKILMGVSFIVIFFVICYSITTNGKKIIDNEIELIDKNDIATSEVQESKLETMISQIQPHFIYNVLNSIYYLCGKDPKKAEQATLEFSEYLRTNLNFSKNQSLIPFRDEINHVKNYLALEKMRFEDELNIVYNLETYNFRIPSLSLQPLVENAVKHGINKRKGGGTLIIKSKEYINYFEIQIEDDGVGFDINKPLNDNRRHIGLENARYRLLNLSKATFSISSEIGIGTRIIITLPREAYYEDTSS